MTNILWYFRSSGKTSGPFTSNQLKKLAESGHITSLTEVRRESDESWLLASNVKGLIDKPITKAIPLKPETNVDKKNIPKKAQKEFFITIVASSSLFACLFLFLYMMRGDVPRNENVQYSSETMKNPSSKKTFMELEGELKKIASVYFLTGNIQNRYTNYCVPGPGVLYAMKRVYGDSLNNAKLDPNEAGLNKLRIWKHNDDMSKVVLISEVDPKNPFAFCFKRTPVGYRIDWWFSQYASGRLLNDQSLFAIGRLVERGDWVETSLIDVEHVPERFKDKTILLLGVEVRDFSSIHISSLPGVTIESNGISSLIDLSIKEKWLGLVIRQKPEDSFFFRCFVEKEKYDVFKTIINDKVKVNLLCRPVMLSGTGGEIGLIITDFDQHRRVFFDPNESITIYD